jgi:uncharacterized protein
MKLFTEARLLRVFIGESDKVGGRPLYQVIVERAKQRDLAGATVLRGILGFGAESRIRTAKILRLSEDLPLVVEIVDEPERINDFAAEVDGMVKDGMVTVQDVQVIIYRSHGEKS